MAHNPASTACYECHLSKACMAVSWRCSTSTGHILWAGYSMRSEKARPRASRLTLNLWSGCRKLIEHNMP